MMKHILIVDDQAEIRDSLETYLKQHAFQVTQADGGKEMRSVLAAEQIDLVLLDVMMPDEDGLTLCKYLLEIQGPPVIMLTAMDDATDCVVGLEMGADDYITKPFIPRVLLARIKAVLRRQQPETKTTEIQKESDTAYHFDIWRLDKQQRQLIRNDDLIVPLSSSDFYLLEVFLAHPQQVLSRDQILNLTKGRDAFPFDRSIDNQISRLRKKIEVDPQHPSLIKTVWGDGYMFTGKNSK
ncbi:response regulator [Colwellia piezophila]|uniref:response regulator n=1 Tax=Colwellia piezophila TaxID=211668 RepID=UPI00035F6614|nr:response regulator [Colwellia piezophila]